VPGESGVCYRHLPHEYVGEAERVLPDKSAEIVVYGCSVSTWPISVSSWALGSRARGGKEENAASEVAGRGCPGWI
jgi:hypothetical protein